MELTGLTWLNPRGVDPLVATAAAWHGQHPSVRIRWEAFPWIDFEHRLLDSLFGDGSAYDLVMIDHPWVGSLAARGGLRAWDELGDPLTLRTLQEQVVAPSYQSYLWDQRLWALPVDAACHSGLIRRDLLDPTDVPGDWAQLADWARDRRGRTCPFPLVLSLSSVLGHCLFLALMQALDRPPYIDPRQPRCDSDAATRVLETVVGLLPFVPPGSTSWGPWDIYERMTREDVTAYCPQIFGYVNYFDARARRRLRLIPCPRVEGHPPSPILGGVGLAVTARSPHPEAAAAYARFTMSLGAQRDLFPRHHGQPSRAEVWEDPALNHAVDHFYRDLRPQMAQAFIRPRYPGFHEIELRNARVLQELWDGRATVAQTVRALERPLSPDI